MRIIPAILTNDIEDLRGKLEKIEGLTEWVQIDIMDGNFVDNTSCEVKDLPQDLIKSFNLEIHLMVQEPVQYFQECEDAEAKKVFFHAEAVENINNVLRKAAKFSFETGLALNPDTPLNRVKNYLNEINSVLLLGVNPGFQGQQFIPEILEKVKDLKKINPNFKVEVDGGINISNIKEISQANPDYLVIGSGLWSSENIKKRFKELQSQI